MSRKKTSDASNGPAESGQGNGKPPLRLEWIEAGSLAENPHNWRKHPPGQVSALKDVLGDPEIGWAGACLYNERTKRLIDGHARRNAVDPKTPVPVLIGDWSEEAEKKILLTLDPLAGMADTNVAALQLLADDVDLSGEAFAGLNAALEGLAADASEVATSKSSAGSGGTKSAKEQWKIIIDCKNEADQVKKLKRFTKEGLKCRALVG